jgi:Protein of unknown function (DUF3619)
MSTTYSHRFESGPEDAQDQFGRRLVARLSEASDRVPHDISERLRVARVQALAKRKKLQPLLVSQVSASGSTATLHFDNERIGAWGRLASLLPLVALLVGLVTINQVQNDRRANEVAEVDSALLTDDLPPAAYVDPGFAQFLKAGKERAE